MIEPQDGNPNDPNNMTDAEYTTWYEAAGRDSEYAPRDDTYERWEFADDPEFRQYFCLSCGAELLGVRDFCDGDCAVAYEKEV